MEPPKIPTIPQTAMPQAVVKRFPKFNLKALSPYILGSILVVLAGVGTGWLITSRGNLGSAKSAPGTKTTVNEAGFAEEKGDSAEGTLEEGGISGEGTHHLVRPGGASQTVYLTSTVIDLQSFVGKKVKVWGETISAKKAPWLMDVGKVKVTQ